jgi:hypothetical protein
MDESPKTIEARAGAALTMGKDAVALLRDAALFFLGILLILFPGQFNSMLVRAGFEEGSIVGFTWKKKLVESDDALQKAQATISELQHKNDELVVALTEAKTHSQDSAFDTRVDRLRDDNRRLKDATQQVQAAVSQTIDSNVPLVQKALAASSGRAADVRPKLDYSVGVQTVGLTDDERAALNSRVRAEGYSLDSTSVSYPAGQRPSWFAPRSTVFYYASSALPTAQELARFMKSATGQDYAVQRGAGLGVDPARRDVTLFVHYIKN